MKFLNIIAPLAAGLVALGTVSCSDDTPEYTHYEGKDVDFTYNVEGNEYTLDYYVVSAIRFNNTSSKSGAVTWDFGDGTTSNEPNPVHKFQEAGNYKVTLTIDGVGSRTYPIMIYDIVPNLTIAEQSTEIVEFNNTTLSFNLELPNPEDLKVRYEWRFPEGTTTADGQPLTTFTGFSENGTVDYPGEVKFSNIGSQRIEISTWFDVDGVNRRLEDIYLNVQVGCQEPAATLYYAQRGGNIKALKLVDLSKLPAGTKVLPYDMGVSAGSTALNLAYADDDDSYDAEGNTVKQGWIYISDPGKQYTYINDGDGMLGDGYINAMRTDGTGVNTVITNVGGPAFCDPFRTCVNAGYLYFSDRNQGISRTELTTRGGVIGTGKSGDTYLRTDYVMKNNLIPYYNKGIAYGAVPVSIERDSRGVWWVAYGYNGYCVIRYQDSDIYKTQAEADKAVIPYPVIGSGNDYRAMTIDETRGALYTWNAATGKEGFYACPLPGDKEAPANMGATFFKAMEAEPINTTGSESVNTCQFALDKETGRVYFCWRPTATDSSNIPAGIVYYDPATKKIVRYSESTDLGLGICINPNKTKLF
ncbi:MAG: PKD domain-containing protein [Muribaculaceae bacterium]